MTWFFVFFFLSGFCSILYELIWLRLAMAEFGVTTALVSIVLSVFMAGFGAGSWIAGAVVLRYGDQIKFPPLRLYAISELLIGISALLVPLQLSYGNHLLERMASNITVSSGTYYAASGAWLALSLIPWCAGKYIDLRVCTLPDTCVAGACYGDRTLASQSIARSPREWFTCSVSSLR